MHLKIIIIIYLGTENSSILNSRMVLWMFVHSTVSMQVGHWIDWVRKCLIKKNGDSSLLTLAEPSFYNCDVEKVKTNVILTVHRSTSATSAGRTYWVQLEKLQKSEHVLLSKLIWSMQKSSSNCPDGESTIRFVKWIEQPHKNSSRLRF